MNSDADIYCENKKGISVARKSGCGWAVLVMKILVPVGMEQEQKVEGLGELIQCCGSVRKCGYGWEVPEDGSKLDWVML